MLLSMPDGDVGNIDVDVIDGDVVANVDDVMLSLLLSLLLLLLLQLWLLLWLWSSLFDK